MPLLRGLLNSLKQFGNPQPYSDIGCLDVGLNAENRAWVSSQGVHVVEPGWDLPVDPAMRERMPYLRSLTARPFLPAYFPGYDMYVWIDCDAWVQERFVFDWLFNAAKDGELGIVPELQPAYKQNITASWRAHRLAQYYNEDFSTQSLTQNYFNAGVFALTADAQHWAHWARHFDRGLRATHGTLVCDQTALNGAIWSDSLPVHPLPSLCNWLCHLALPVFSVENAKFCEPFTPHNTIGILHLTSATKDLVFRLNNKNGLPIEISLRFPVADQTPL
jgi:hypothetical protein